MPLPCRQFKGCGTCTLMPQGGDPTAPRAAATAFQCAVKQGLVWVKLKPAPKDGSGGRGRLGGGGGG